MKEETRQQINELIYRFRSGDKGAELFLYERYKKRVQFYVYKNVWFNELKDYENLIEDILQKLFNWFKDNKIEKSDKAVVYNLVRRECASQGRKDKREIASNFETTSSKDGNPQRVGNKYLDGISEKISNDNLSDERIFFSKPRIDPILELNLSAILSKCVKNLTKQQQKVLDLYIYHGYTYAEIGGIINRSNVTAHNNTKKAINSLKACFRSHGINTLSDLK